MRLLITKSQLCLCSTLSKNNQSLDQGHTIICHSSGGLEGRNTFLDVTQQGHKMSVFFYQHHMTYIIYICWCVTWLPLPLPLTWFNPSIRARGWWRTPAWETEAFCSRACDCLLSPDGNIPEEPGWHCLLSPRRPQPSLVDGINLESWLTSLRYAQSPGRQNTLS